MSTTLTVRLNETCTYEVHVEMGNPPQKFVGGLSLNLENLKTELEQHGCSSQAIVQTLQEVSQHGSARVQV